MGCCENSRNILGYQNKSSATSSSLIGLKETNLSNGISIDSNICLDNVIKTLLRNKTPKLSLNKFQKYKVLDRIKEESESRESTVNNQKNLSREKNVDNLKQENSNSKNIKLENIKLLRKNRSHPRFKTKLNEEMFLKKINEYKKNSKIRRNNFVNYISQFSVLKESNSEQLFYKTMDELNLKDSINKINKEKKVKKNKKYKRNNIYTAKKEKDSITQYYEDEEINKNSIQHVPRSISKTVFITKIN